MLAGVTYYDGPSVGPWRLPARIGKRPRTNGTGGFQSVAAKSKNSDEAPVNMDDDSLPTPLSQDEGQQPESRKLNENKGFTNSCGEPYLAGSPTT
jgi:hypothetical protein